MLILLPLLVWFLTFLFWSGRSEGSSGADADIPSAGLSVVLASICWGAYLALTTELLSLANALTTPGVALAWSAALIFLVVLGIRGGFIWRGLQRMGAGWRSLKWDDFILGGVLLLFSAALLVIVILSSSGNNDSLQYHLARVMHWTQNASLRHYATGFVPQLYNPIWAEEAILHFRLLWGNDRFADLVQWLAMLASLAALSAICSELGIGRRGRWIAVIFAFSLPMGVLQSVSTQNDYVAGFWLLCAALLCIRLIRRPSGRLDALMLGLAVGLGLLTKGTFYPFVVPFGLLTLFVVIRWAWSQSDRKLAFRHAAASCGIMVLAIFGLNAGYWARNFDTFGGPLGPSFWVSRMTAGSVSIGGFFSGLIAQVAMNFSTPFDAVNNRIIELVRGKLGPLDARMNSFDLSWQWNREDMAGNPLHVILIIAAILLLLVCWKRVQDRRLWVYLACLGGAFATFVLVVHFDRYGIRYQLPLFLLSVPLVGAAVDPPTARSAEAPPAVRSRFRRAVAWGWDGGRFAAALVLLLLALPLVLFNRSRPLLALKDGGEPYSIPCQPYLGCTLGSVLLEPETTGLFAENVHLRDAYTGIAAAVRGTGCQDVGLRIDSHDPEYLFWWLLDAPQSGLRLESIYTNETLQRYIDPTFKPCAIICTLCGSRTRLHGLELSGNFEGVKLFTGDGFEADEGPEN